MAVTANDLVDAFHSRVATAWGDAVIVARGPDVLRLRPPLPTSARAREAVGATDAELAGLPAAAIETLAEPVRRFGERLVAYFDGEPVDLASPDEASRWLAAAGVRGFRHDVLVALAGVPRGMTVSYGELAMLAGRPGAARAAGTACATNPLPVLVPCHRVVHAGARPGDVGTYGAGSGSAYKRRLLELEGAAHASAPAAGQLARAVASSGT